MGESTWRNLRPDEFRRWNALYSCNRLARLIEANFEAGAYYVIKLDTSTFAMDRDGVLADFKSDVIRPLRPLVKELKYIYTIQQDRAGEFYIHMVTNARWDVMHEALEHFWLYNGTHTMQRVVDLPPQRIAEAMTLDAFGVQGQRKKRMYIPSKNLHDLYAPEA